MKRLLFCRVYCDLAFAAAAITVLYPRERDKFLNANFYLWMELMTILIYILLGIIITIIRILVSRRKPKLPSYRNQVILFRVELGILAGALLLCLLAGNQQFIEYVALPFIFIFLVLSVFLLRTIRNWGNKRTEKVSAIVALVVLIISIPYTNAVKQAMSFVAEKIVHQGPKKKYYKRYGLMFPKWLWQSSDSKSSVITVSSLVKIIMMILAIALVLLFIFLLLRHFWHHRHNLNIKHKPVVNQSLFEEHRNFIRQAIDHSSAKRKQLWPRSSRDIVRACYAKFMRLCEEKSVGIKASDTTGQINEKYGEKYPAVAADALRSIYVRVRYSTETVSKELAEQSMAEYRQIRQKASPVKGQSL